MAKFRTGFVSNSSSCSFMIKNQSSEHKTIKDFAKETLYLVSEFNEYYDCDESHSVFLNNVSDYPMNLDPDESAYMIFGDEHGTTMGKIYDYMLRDGGSTESFSWYMVEMMR